MCLGIRQLAGFAAALYGLHPASAETVNYIVQRGDLFVALGLVAGIVIICHEVGRAALRWYLLPPLAAMFAKPTALIFAPFLLVYIVLFDRGDRRRSLKAGPAFASMRRFCVRGKDDDTPDLLSPPRLNLSTIGLRSHT